MRVVTVTFMLIALKMRKGRFCGCLRNLVTVSTTCSPTGHPTLPPFVGHAGDHGGHQEESSSSIISFVPRRQESSRPVLSCVRRSVCLINTRGLHCESF